MGELFRRIGKLRIEASGREELLRLRRRPPIPDETEELAIASSLVLLSRWHSWPYPHCCDGGVGWGGCRGPFFSAGMPVTAGSCTTHGASGLRAVRLIQGSFEALG